MDSSGDLVDEESPSQTSCSDEGEWRLPVRVISFQRASRYSHLWVTHGETIEEVLTRARIGGIWELLVPDARPPPIVLHSSHTPVGGPLVSLSRFLLPWDIVPLSHTWRSFALMMCLAMSSLAMGQMVNGTLSSPAVFSQGVVGTVPDVADMLFVQAQGLPVPTLCVATILADASLDMPSRDVPAPPTANPMTYVLLGPEFEQFVLEIAVGPTLPQIARITGIPPLTHHLRGAQRRI